MSDQWVELNKTINALWEQVPEDLRESLQEKFYAYISTGKAEKLKVLVEENPIMKEIALTDQSIISGPVYEYYPEMIKYLVAELGIDVDFRRPEAINRTQLSEVLFRHHRDHRNVNFPDQVKFDLKCRTVEILLELGADVNAVDFLCDTSLHYAISRLGIRDLVELNNGLAIIEMLLEKGANPNLQEHNGMTPLYLALSNTQIPLFLLEPIVELLIQYGADETIADYKGITPKILILQRPPVTHVGMCDR